MLDHLQTLVPDAPLQEAVTRFARDHNVIPLLVVDMGERAWGFEEVPMQAVRFPKIIYMHQPEWYYRIATGNDGPVGVVADATYGEGWDAIKLKGNDVRFYFQGLERQLVWLFEWLRSPVVYMKDQVFTDALRPLLEGMYPVERAYAYYTEGLHSMYKTAIQTKRRSKKKAETQNNHLLTATRYADGLRLALTARWLREERMQPAATWGMPPNSLFELLKLYPQEDWVMEIMEQIFRMVKQGNGKRAMHHIPRMDEYFAELVAGLPPARAIKEVGLDDVTTSRFEGLMADTMYRLSPR